MNELMAEGLRVNRLVERTLRQATIVEEVPLRLHSRDIDSGGAPEFHPAFMRLLEQGVCTCGRPAECAPGCRFINDRFLGHLDACQPACPRDDHRFHQSIHKNNPNRLNRTFRQLRRLNPKAYDLVFLIVGRGYSWENATAKLRADDISRGHEPRTDLEFGVLYISGASMLVGSF